MDWVLWDSMGPGLLVWGASGWWGLSGLGPALPVKSGSREEQAPALLSGLRPPAGVAAWVGRASQSFQVLGLHLSRLGSCLSAASGFDHQSDPLIRLRIPRAPSRGSDECTEDEKALGFLGDLRPLCSAHLDCSQDCRCQRRP